MAVMTFREMVEQLYIPKGETSYSARVLIHRETGRNVSMSTLRAAYFGTRIEVDSAKKLMLWSQAEHPKVTLNYAALISAPPAGRAPSWRTWTDARPTKPGDYRVRGLIPCPMDDDDVRRSGLATVAERLGRLHVHIHGCNCYWLNGVYDSDEQRIETDRDLSQMQWSGPFPASEEP